MNYSGSVTDQVELYLGDPMWYEGRRIILPLYKDLSLTEMIVLELIVALEYYNVQWNYLEAEYDYYLELNYITLTEEVLEEVVTDMLKLALTLMVKDKITVIERYLGNTVVVLRLEEV